MFYIIYKTINIVNKKFYIGKHSTNNLNDSYLGSGLLLNKAIKKYGREQFERKILYIFDNYIDMTNKEKAIVNPKLLKNPRCYNLRVGGDGG